MWWINAVEESKETRQVSLLCFRRLLVFKTRNGVTAYIPQSNLILWENTYKYLAIKGAFVWEYSGIRIYSGMEIQVFRNRKSSQTNANSAKIWNAISDNIKLLSLKQFKKKFKSNIIASY